MKTTNKLIVLLFTVFLSQIGIAQDIRTFFKLLPMPYNFGLSNKVKQALLKKQTLHGDELDSLSRADFHSFTIAVDVKNGYLSVDGDEAEAVEMCCWKIANEDSYKLNEERYLIAVFSNICGSPGCETSSMQFYIYQNKTLYTTGQPFTLSLQDFLKDNITKEQMEYARQYVSLWFRLPKEGKNIKVFAEMQELDGCDLHELKTVLKGNYVGLLFQNQIMGEIFFTKTEPIWKSDFSE